MFRQLAEICGKYLTKGKQVYIEGKLQTRSWEKDGVTHYTTEIVARDMQNAQVRRTVVTITDPPKTTMDRVHPRNRFPNHPEMTSRFDEYSKIFFQKSRF